MSENSSSSKKLSTKQRKIFRGVGASLLLSGWAIGVFYLVQYFLAGAFLLILQQGGIFDFDSLSIDVQNVVGVAVIFLLTLLIVIAVPWLVLRYATTKKELGLERLLSWTDLLVGPVAFIPYIILSVVLGLIAAGLFTGYDAAQTQELGLKTFTNGFGTTMAFIALVVIAPIAEEVIFRGYLYGKIKGYIGTIAATIFVSICFGAVHGQWNVAIDVFALSVVLCGLRELTGSIWSGIVLHMAKNAVAFAALFTFVL